MDHVQANRPTSGRGALGWAAFVLVALVVTAALMAGVIRRSFWSPASSTSIPSLSSPTEPAPTPLPKPGAAPPHTALAAP